MRLFVSHAGRDRAWAEWISWQLQHGVPNVEVELDSWDWQAGDNIIAKMNAALTSCDHMIAICSQAYYESSRWTSDELAAALHHAKGKPGFLVPLRIDDARPPPLLAPLAAPALHGLPPDIARDTIMAAIYPAGRPSREPPHPEDLSICEYAPRVPGTLPAVWGLVPGPNEAFTGRDGMLVELRQGLLSASHSAIYALHGAGGVGKTQLAAEYVWRFAGDYDLVWWVNAEQVDRIAEQYAALAVAKGLVDPTTPVELAVDALRGFCRGNGRWLIVLDNAGTHSDIHQWRLVGPGHLLITSRHPYWPEVATAMSVDVFNRVESVKLLRDHVPTLSDQEAGSLAEALGDLPLALAQAAGVLAETGMPPAEYQDLLNDAAAEVLDEGGSTSYPRSLAQSLRVAVSHLAAADEAAFQLLTLCAFLAPEPIPVVWFVGADQGILPEPLATTASAPLAYRRSLGVLGRYGLAKVANNHIAIHRLTQSLLRADATNADTAIAAVAMVVAGLNPGKPGDPKSWPAWASLLPHLRVLVLNHTDDEQLAKQVCAATQFLLERGEIRIAHDLIAPLYYTWRARLGLAALPTLWSASRLARALGQLGKYGEAVALNRELLNHLREVYDDDNPKVLAVANNLAAELYMLGDYEQALALDEDSLRRCQQKFGEDHEDTLVSASNLAIRLGSLGRHEEALILAEDTLQRRHRTLGENHLQTLTSANNLATDLGSLGRHEEACALAEDTLSRRRRILGDDHPDTLDSANTVAIELGALGRHEEARILAEDTLSRRRRVLGSEHPSTSLSAETLAKVLRERGSKSR